MQKIFLFLTLYMPITLLPCTKLYKKNTLTTQIKQIIERHPALHIGCALSSLNKNMPLYNHHATHLFIPASNTKLFTAALALEKLSPTYTFATYLKTDGYIKKGTLHGNVYIKGSGDPSFTAVDLESLIDALHKKGVTTITESVCFDDTDFDYEMFAPGSLLDNIGASWNSPISAFMVDQKPFILHQQNHAAFINTEKLKNIYFDGAAYLQTLMRKYQIKVMGTFKHKTCPTQSAVLYKHQSKNITELIAHMLKESNNIYADCIFKKIGSLLYGYPGTWQKGADALTALLTSMHIFTENLCFSDGSGRSRYTLISPEHILSLLKNIYHKPYFSLFKNSLSQAGIDGTLSKRMSDLTPCIYAKTGTLCGVSSLCGYIDTQKDMVAFAIIINGYVSDSLYNPPCKTEVEDAICRVIVQKNTARHT